MRRHERKRARDLGTRRRRETLHGDRLDGDGPDAGDSAALGLHASECRQGNPRDDPLFFHPGPTSHRDRECHATMDEREMIEATQEKLPELESNQENFQQGHLTRTNFGAIETDGIKLPDIPSPPSPLPPPITFKNVETNKSLEPKPRNGVDLIRAPDLDRSHREIQQSLNKLREEACAIQALRNTEASRASILRHETLLRELNSNPQSTTPHATTTQRQASQPASEIGSEFPAMILAWRIWLAIYMSILSILMGLCVRAIFVDKFPCDEGLWQFTICNASVMMMQIAICLALMFKLPAPALGTILRMTWNVHQRFQHVRAGFLASFFFSLFQIALIPAGIALVKNASDECVSTDS
ncbi:hypothetical protein BC830DRAFT_445283 [Chytriomyces sp. MP71]|nr:hypothetical protein BC830DRAFT_445283 [Chytriomyces sp. MP71]